MSICYYYRLDVGFVICVLSLCFERFVDLVDLIWFWHWLGVLGFLWFASLVDFWFVFMFWALRFYVALRYFVGVWVFWFVWVLIVWVLTVCASWFCGYIVITFRLFRFRVVGLTLRDCFVTIWFVGLFDKLWFVSTLVLLVWVSIDLFCYLRCLGFCATVELVALHCFVGMPCGCVDVVTLN